VDVLAPVTVIPDGVAGRTGATGPGPPGGGGHGAGRPLPDCPEPGLLGDSGDGCATDGEAAPLLG